LAWTILALCADFFVLGGSIIQVGGRFWVRHLRGLGGVSLPAGGKQIDIHSTNDNLDIYGFLSIGVGSVYFIFNDAGLSSSSTALLSLCIVETIIILVLGFFSYAVEGENTFDTWKLQIWPWHAIPFVGALIGTSLIAMVVVMAIALGWLDWLDSLPLLLVSASLVVYILKSFNQFKTHRKPPWNG
jgi:hypothetical protein